MTPLNLAQTDLNTVERANLYQVSFLNCREAVRRTNSWERKDSSKQLKPVERKLREIHNSQDKGHPVPERGADVEEAETLSKPIARKFSPLHKLETKGIRQRRRPGI